MKKAYPPEIRCARLNWRLAKIATIGNWWHQESALYNRGLKPQRSPTERDKQRVDQIASPVAVGPGDIVEQQNLGIGLRFCR